MYTLWPKYAHVPCLLALVAAGRLSAQAYSISTIAGGEPPATPVLALTASVMPWGLAVDSAGSAYFTSVHCVFKIGRDGVVTRIAGNSRLGFSGDGGPAVNAQLNEPRALAVDLSGNVYCGRV